MKICRNGHTYDDSLTKRGNCPVCKYNYHRLRDDTPKGFAKHLLTAYKSQDKKRGLRFDLTYKWMMDNILNQPCYACGVTHDEERIGCDRIDNSKGHSMDNVLPCCGPCNRARGETFTVEEMKTIIGPAIRLVRNNRKIL